jgi:hypothetical protein
MHYDVLRKEFDAAVLEINNSRPGSKLTTAFYSRVGDWVFAAGCEALKDSSTFFDEAEIFGKNQHRLHVVPAPVGSGKTSFSLAFIAALIRYDPTASAVMVVDQIAKADEMFKDLESLLPGKVAVWSSEHCLDRNVPLEERKLVGQPAAKFHKEALQNFPVAVVTHAFFSGKGSHKAKRVLGDGGKLRPRTLTVVDERFNEAAIFDIALSDAQKVLEVVLADEQYAETVGPHVEHLVEFMSARFGGAGTTKYRDLERPKDAKEAWSIADKLQWFTGPQAADFVRAHPRTSAVQAVFGFAKALATGYAFIARNIGGAKSTHYIGYESNLIDMQGCLVLDATADLDGITQLCPWHVPAPCPSGRYDNLQVVSILPHTKKRLSTYLGPVPHRRAYAAWITDTIKAQMQPGQKGLIICKKILFDNQDIPTWPVGDQRHSNKKSFTENYGWDLEGRQLCATHWGSGIGVNCWREADVVFLFDEFYIPRRTVIATAQGLQGYKAIEGSLDSMKVQNSPEPAVERLWEGHLLRQLKQMALRGGGRNFDEHGICSPQKLVCSADRTRLLSNFNRLFPGAKIEVVTASPRGGQKQPYADTLLGILGSPGLPDVISTGWLSAQMHTPWRNVSKNIMQIEPVQRAIVNLGWTYVSRKGRGGSTFERDTVMALEAEAA